MRETGNPFNLTSNAFGIVLVLSGMVLLSTMDATVKYVVEGGISVMQMLAMRSWLVVPLLILWMVLNGGFRQLKTDKPFLHFLRVFFGFGAPFFFFNAISQMELAEATVVFFSASFIMTALSIPILKERVGIHRWGSIALGFTGVVIAADLTGEAFNVGALYSFAAAISYSLMMIITRLIGNSEGTFKLLFYFHLWGGLVSSTAVLLGVGGLAYAPIELSFSMQGWGGIALITVLVIVGHYGLMRAFSIAPIGLLAPYEYSIILTAAFFGYIIWGHVPATNFWVGAALVVLSGIYMVYREIKVKDLGDATADISASVGPVAAPIPPSISVDKD